MYTSNYCCILCLTFSYFVYCELCVTFVFVTLLVVLTHRYDVLWRFKEFKKNNWGLTSEQFEKWLCGCYQVHRYTKIKFIPIWLNYKDLFDYLSGQGKHRSLNLHFHYANCKNFPRMKLDQFVH